MAEDRTSAPVDGATAAEALLDGFYTAVGLSVLAINRVQVARRDAARYRAEQSGQAEDPAAPGGADGTSPLERLRHLASDPENLRAVATRLHRELQSFDDLVVEIEQRVDEILDRVEPDLPEGGRELVRIARSTAKDLTVQGRAVLGLRIP